MLKLVHDATATAVDDPETMTIGLDELCRVAAQEMLAVALLAERRPISKRTPQSSTPRASAWWSATATPGRGR